MTTNYNYHCETCNITIKCRNPSDKKYKSKRHNNTKTHQKKLKNLKEQEKQQVEQVFISNQTNLVNKILKLDDELWFNVVWRDEDEEEDRDVYLWWLVKPEYQDNIKNLSNFCYLEYEGEMWMGQTWYGTGIENTDEWKQFEEKFTKEYSI